MNKYTVMSIFVAATLAATNAFAAYGDHALLRSQTGGPVVTQAASGSSASVGQTKAPQASQPSPMADFFRQSDLGSRNSSAR